MQYSGVKLFTIHSLVHDLKIKSKIGPCILILSLVSGGFYNPILSQDYIITNVAGIKHSGYTGDGGPATNAHLAFPTCVYLDNLNNIYISDWGNSRVRMVNPVGTINTIAGNGIYGYSGDGGPATAAEFNGPMGIYIDASKNIYVADVGNERIRKIGTDGIINTIAGNGVFGFSGDNGPALLASFKDPSGICGDDSGNIYIADEFNNRIRKIDKTVMITTIAGNGISGYTGDGGFATSPELYYPAGVAMDKSGNIIIADEDNNAIREINPAGIISTIAGNGVADFSGDGGPAAMAMLYNPAGVVVDNNENIYITDGFNNRIRMINSDGIISTIAGNGIAGLAVNGDTATRTSLHEPVSIFVDPSGTVYIANEFNQFVQKLTFIPKVIEPTADFTVYPNPNQGEFTIKIQNFQTPLRMEVYNILGQQISYVGLNTQETLINLKTSSKGIYFYRVITSENRVLGTGKVVVF